MMDSKFNEMYLKISQAKSFDKKGNSHSALKIYLDIIENYKPNDDFVYKRACIILASNGDYTKVKNIANKSINEMKDGDISGDIKFFVDILKKSEERLKEKSYNNSGKFVKNNNKSEKNSTKENFLFFENKVNFTFLMITILFFIVISVPDKIFKLMFLVFGTFAVFFLIHIIYDIVKQFKYKIKVVLFIVSLCLSFFGLYKMPPSNWDKFFDVPSIQIFKENNRKFEDINFKKDKDNKTTQEDNDDSEAETSIQEDDLDKLRSAVENETDLNSYKISIQGDKIYLDIKLKEGANKNDGKRLAISILNNLSMIKGKNNEDEAQLGNLYDEYSIKVNIVDSFNSSLCSGSSKKSSKKIIWK